MNLSWEITGGVNDTVKGSVLQSGQVHISVTLDFFQVRKEMGIGFPAIEQREPMATLLGELYNVGTEKAGTAHDQKMLRGRSSLNLSPQ
jgi:hypothetical protein